MLSPTAMEMLMGISCIAITVANTWFKWNS